MPVKEAAHMSPTDGLTLQHLLAGVRPNGKHVKALKPKEVCDRVPDLEPSTLTRVLRGHRVGEVNLRRIAKGLGVSYPTAQKAYTETRRVYGGAK
jgi:hypothetical protein